MHHKNDQISVKDYAVKVSNISKGCPPGIEREIQKQFIRFGKIVEIIPITDYNKALLYEIEIRKVGELIGDRKAKDQIRGQNNQKKINSLIHKEQKLNTLQKNVYQKMRKDVTPSEVIVVFETVQMRNDCLAEYSKYSHWWSRPQKGMPPNLMLHGKYGYKVKEAPHPFDYIVENWYYGRWIPLVIFILAGSIAIVGSTLALYFMVPTLNDKFDNLPIYTECNKYYFDSVTVADYVTAGDSVEEVEKS